MAGRAGCVRSSQSSSRRSASARTALAGRLLTGPGLFAEFVPNVLDTGYMAAALPSRYDGTVDEFYEAVQDEVADSIRSEPQVGVRLSSGMDSLAMLYTVVRLRGSTTGVVAVVTDLLTDDKRGTWNEAARNAEAVAPGVEVLRVPPSQEETQVSGSRQLRLDALPADNDAAEKLCAQRGVTVVLTGCGSDEAVTVPQFALPEIAQSVGHTRSARYLRDVGVAGTVDDVLGRILSARGASAAASYAHLGWSDLFDDTALTAVQDNLGKEARTWAIGWREEWLEDIRKSFERGVSWAERYAHDAVHPQCTLPDGNAVKLVHPFRGRVAMEVAQRVPVARKWNPDLPTPYARTKALTAALLPRDVLPLLGQRKQTYRGVLRGSDDYVDTPNCYRAGVASHEVTPVRNASTRLMWAQLEQWFASQ